MQAYRELFELFDSLDCDDIEAVLSQLVAAAPEPLPPLDYPLPVYRPDDWPGGVRPQPPYEGFTVGNPWESFELPPPEAGTLDETDEPPDKERKRRVWSILSNILVIAVSLVVVVGMMLITFSRNPDKSFLGYRVFRVTSGSMTPTRQLDGSLLKGGFFAGDAIIVKLADAHSVAVGDIITVNREGEALTLTHRVMEILEGYEEDETRIAFVTKGDNNPSYDLEPVPGSALVGIKVLTLPAMGHVFGFAQTHFVLTICICVLAVLLSFGLFLLASRRKVPRRKLKEDEAEPEAEPAHELPHELPVFQPPGAPWPPPPNYGYALQ